MNFQKQKIASVFHRNRKTYRGLNKIQKWKVSNIYEKYMEDISASSLKYKLNLAH